MTIDSFIEELERLMAAADALECNCDTAGDWCDADQADLEEEVFFMAERKRILDMAKALKAVEELNELKQELADNKAHAEMVIDEVCEARDKFKQERNEAIEFIHNLIGDVAKGATLLYLTNKMISFMED